jgi:cellulose synthase/poly-beta-1,6-N-acetylglucosamine synthase-like glycosyltransferase
VSFNTQNYTISTLLAFYGDIQILEKKIENFLSLDYPKEYLEMIVCFDGPIPNQLPDSFTNIPNLKITSLKERKGKTFALNEAARHAKGELLLFTDADALFPPDTVKKLVRHFEDPKIGGVFGKRTIERQGDESSLAQRVYVFLESYLKIYESRFGSTTSNDGKLYIIRREYHEPIAHRTTDDLYCALRVIAKGKRFIFDPEAVAYIKRPSANLRHEFIRRVRVVSQSMMSLFLNIDLFNAKKFGFYSVGLFINKVLRRFLGIFLLGMFVSSMGLSSKGKFFSTLLILQLIFYAVAFSAPIFERIKTRFGPAKLVSRISNIMLYFIVGCAGSLAGIVFFLLGKTPSKWEPIKV